MMGAQALAIWLLSVALVGAVALWVVAEFQARGYSKLLDRSFERNQEAFDGWKQSNDEWHRFCLWLIDPVKYPKPDAAPPSPAPETDTDGAPVEGDGR